MGHRIQFILIFSVLWVSTNISAQDAMTIVSSGAVGIGTETPLKKLTVNGSDDGLRTDNSTMFLLENSSSVVGTRVLFNLINNGGVRFDMFDQDTGNNWVFQNQYGSFDITLAGTGTREFRFFPNGNLEIAGTYLQSSSRYRKHGFEAVDTQLILDRLIDLPIMKWSYDNDKDASHVGPVSEDFYSIFGLGSSSRAISTVDASGIAFAAIQGLKNEKDGQVSGLMRQNADLKRQLRSLNSQFSQMSERFEIQSLRLEKLESLLNVR